MPCAIARSTEWLAMISASMTPARNPRSNHCRASARCRSVGIVVLLVVALASVLGRPAVAASVRDRYRQVYVRLTNDASAIIDEPVGPESAVSDIAVLTSHPEHANTFNSFIAAELAKRGYRVMMMNYYGPEHTYEEFLPPLAAAVRYLRSLPGVEKVVLAGASTGASELTYYQDVAENGPRKACQGFERIYKCNPSGLENLPPADGVVLLDANIGAPARTIAIDPAVDSGTPWKRNPALDMFAARNGFDPATRSGRYSAAFVRRFLKAQGARNDRVIDRALARLAKIGKGKGSFKDDEPFLVAGFSVALNGARLDIADRKLLSRTRLPHLLLKANGSEAREIIRSLAPPMASDKDLDTYYRTTPLGSQTVRHYLSFYGLWAKADYSVTSDDVKGIVWRSTANDAVGNVEQIRVPTLVIAGSCSPQMVLNEIAFEHSAAKDKEFVAVQGANHFFEPCKPKYGDTRKRTFDFVDAWLNKPDRFLSRQRSPGA